MQTANTRIGQSRSDLAFGLLWGLLTAIGLAAGLMGGLSLMWSLGDSVGQAAVQPLTALLMGMAGGAVIGAALGIQAILLGGRIQRPWRWTLASIAGAAIVLGVVMLLFYDRELDGLVSVLVLGGLIGLTAGLIQWRLLRPSFGRAAWWVAFSTVALAIGMAITFSLGGEGRELLGFSAGALLAGVIEGAGMVWLLRN